VPSSGPAATSAADAAAPAGAPCGELAAARIGSGPQAAPLRTAAAASRERTHAGTELSVDEHGAFVVTPLSPHAVLAALSVAHHEECEHGVAALHVIESASMVLQVLEPMGLQVAPAPGNSGGWHLVVVGRGTQVVHCSGAAFLRRN
jgi:hypothetical protein